MFSGEGNELKFGRQRCWGTIGFGVTACLTGYMIDWWSQNKIYKNYAPSIFLAIIFTCIDFICCIQLKVIVLCIINLKMIIYGLVLMLYMLY